MNLELKKVKLLLNKKRITLLIILLQIGVLAPIAVMSISGNFKETNVNLAQQDTIENPTSLQDYYQAVTTIDWDFSTYFGGSSEDFINDVEVDSNNNIIISGYTSSINLPTENAYQENSGGSFDAFIAKFDPTGQSLIFASYLGGNDFDAAVDVTIDSEDNIYLTGLAYSLNFPTVNALSSSRNGICDAFVTKFNPTGDVIFSTFLGGSGEDFCYGVAMDSSNNLVITGHTASSDFPVTSDAYDSSFAGEEDAVLILLNSDGQSIEYSTYLGGSGVDMGLKGFMNYNDEIVIAGLTSSSDFVSTDDALQSSFAGDFDAFVTIFNVTGQVIYSTYYGGNGDEIAQSIGEDSQGNLIIVGRTTANNLPLSTTPLQNQHGGLEDGYVLKLNHQDYSLNFSTYLGGSEYDFAFDFLIDEQDNIIIFGTTASEEFEVTSNAYQTTIGGNLDAFLAILPPNGGSLVYSTFIGGEGDDKGKFITYDNQKNLIIAGFTGSTDFPAFSSFQNAKSSATDGFIGKFSFTIQTQKSSFFTIENLVFYTIILTLVCYSKRRKCILSQQRGCLRHK